MFCMTWACLVGDNTFSPVLHVNASRMSVIALFSDRTWNVQELMLLSFDHVSDDEGMAQIRMLKILLSNSEFGGL